MSELLAGLVEGFIVVIELLFHGLVLFISGAATIVAWPFSKGFRDRKREQWRENKVRKFGELSIGAISLVGLAAFAVWISLPERKNKSQDETRAQIGKARSGEDLRFSLQLTNAGAPITGVTIAIKQGGLQKILETRSLTTLSRQLQENVVVIRQTNAQGKESSKPHLPAAKAQPPADP